jgi:primosomal protein N' (replication factor Y)
VKDKETLTYQVPGNFDVKVGQLVRVPLKKSAKTGVIWEIHENKPEFRTLPVQELINEHPLLSENQIELIKWISSYYFTPLHRVIKLFVPKRIFQNKPIRKSTKKHPATKEIEQKIETAKKVFNEEQKAAFETIINSGTNKFLIHGITGSGKTEIYVKLAAHYIKQEKQVLILVPEISLTPQTIDYFEKSLGIKAAVIHSKLSEGEKYNFWQDINSGKTNIAIGSRSAIFAPFQNLGLIIMDEEHESSYKQDSSPRYLTHRVIDKYLKLNSEIKAVLGSATPSIETAEELKNSTIRLLKRYGDSSLPEVEIVDLREEFKKKNYSIFSEKLASHIKTTLSKKDQAILFLNRRGNATSVVCRDCGFSIKCTECEIPMTYHSKTLGSPTLICHHCGRIEKPPTTCPVCKSVNIRYLGIGTQRIEEDAHKEFSEAKVLRADRDTTGAKHGFKEIYQKFKKREADILVGTQMIAKGLDIPDVNLVGIVLADIGLNIPDYKTLERNFQLITQVAGRAGRKSHTGKVIVQTYNPENLALKYSQTHDYENFFKYEITQRKLLKNPPFSQLCKIVFENRLLNDSKKSAEKTEQMLWRMVREKNLTEDSVEINSYPAYLTRLRGKYRYIVLIKDKTNSGLIHKLLENLPKGYIMDEKLKIDIDPITTV